MKMMMIVGRSRLGSGELCLRLAFFMFSLVMFLNVSRECLFMACLGSDHSVRSGGIVHHEHLQALTAFITVSGHDARKHTSSGDSLDILSSGRTS